MEMQKAGKEVPQELVAEAVKEEAAEEGAAIEQAIELAAASGMTEEEAAMKVRACVPLGDHGESLSSLQSRSLHSTSGTSP